MAKDKDLGCIKGQLSLVVSCERQQQQQRQKQQLNNNLESESHLALTHGQFCT